MISGLVGSGPDAFLTTARSSIHTESSFSDSEEEPFQAFPGGYLHVNTGVFWTLMLHLLLLVGGVL
jgi:hypothetical protein